MKMKSESEVAQLFLTLRDPMDCSLRGSSVHGVFQARVLEWGAIAFSDISLYFYKNIGKIHTADEWIRKQWYIYTMEYYSAIKRIHLNQF